MLKRIYLEISDYCNLACKFCTSPRRNKTMLSLDDYKNIVNKINGHAKELYLHVLGEPLVHPYIFEMIDYAKNYFNVNITTNGRLIEKNHHKLLKAKISKMNISLNSSYDLDKDKLNSYLSSITSFIDDKQKHDESIVFNLRLWAYDLNNTHTKTIIEYLEDYYRIKIENKNNLRLRPKVILTFEDSFDWPSLANPYNTDKGTCLGLKTHISILSNGDVGVCCLDTLCDSKLGNIFDSSLDEILNSSKAKEILKGFNDNKLILDICKHCTFHNRK